MLDNFNRRINYLRISITDRCNLRCRYCMPEEGIAMLSHDQILSFEEIERVTRKAVELGITKVRITGGEPLVRKGVVELIRLLGNIDGIKDLSMTTNGILLGRFAQELKNAGLMRVNVSLDTMDPLRFRYITRNGELNDVVEGIETAISVGLTPVKLNCVITDSSNSPDAKSVKDFAISRGIEVRFIHQMDLAAGHFSVVEGGSGGDCANCSRLRLTADGMIKPCLFNELSYNVRELGPEKAIMQAIEDKPACGSYNYSGKFYNIGG